MLKEILKQNEGNQNYWAGGSDSYKDIKEINNLITQYDFTTTYIEDYDQQLAKQDKNRKIFKRLEKYGVTAISDGTYEVPYNGIKNAKDIDIKNATRRG